MAMSRRSKINKVIKELSKITGLPVKRSSPDGISIQIKYEKQNYQLRSSVGSIFEGSNCGILKCENIFPNYRSLWRPLDSWENDFIPLSPRAIALSAYLMFLSYQTSSGYMFMFDTGLRDKDDYKEYEGRAYLQDFIKVLVDYGEVVCVPPGNLNPNYDTSIEYHHNTQIMLWYPHASRVTGAGRTYNIQKTLKGKFLQSFSRLKNHKVLGLIPSKSTRVV